MRMQYLEALGIPVYVPRYVLPQAKPSKAAVLPITPADVEGQDTALPPRQDTALTEATSAPRGIGSLMQVLQPALSRPEDRPQPAPLAEQVQSAAEDRPAGAWREVRFSLHIWHLGPDTLIVDSHQPRAALPVAALLVNMLFAVGQSKEVGRPERLDWPLLPQLPSAPLQHARDMVSAFMAGRAQGAPVSRVWLMGEQAYLACLDADEDYPAALGQVRKISALATHALVLPSLAEMLQQPASKGVAWRALKHYYEIA